MTGNSPVTFRFRCSITLGLPDFQRNTTTDYLKLNKFGRNIQPRVGLIWDFTGKGKGKLFVNYARYLETPIPLDINVRTGGNDIQLDKNINAQRVERA